MSATQKSVAARPLETVDPVWQRICEEARAAIEVEPAFGGFLHATILDQPRLEDAVVQRLSDRLGNGVVTATMIRRAYAEALAADPSIGEAFRSDIAAVYDRDPPATGSSTRCSTSRASTPSRRTASRIG